MPSRCRPVRLQTSFAPLDLAFSQVEIPFSPNAPPPMVAPVSSRATPYVEPPQSCSYNLRTGTVTCLNQQRAFLDGYAFYPRNVGYGCACGGYGCSQCSGRGPVMQPPFFRPASGYPNYVYGSQIVDERADSPLNRILTRGPVGPWNLVGYAQTNDPANSSSRDRTMMVYSQRVDQGRNRYNYRVTDSNGVPLDIGENVQWKMSGDTVQVPGQSSTYQLHLYSNYQ